MSTQPQTPKLYGTDWMNAVDVWTIPSKPVTIAYRGAEKKGGGRGEGEGGKGKEAYN